MKKGFWTLGIISFAVFFLFSIGIVRAEHCTADNTNSTTGCVCGHFPNSNLGYGQVIIGSNVISCSNTDTTGICPEDFMDASTGKVANCSSCPDPACTATVNGHVYEGDDTTKPVDRVTITSHPIKWDPNASLETSVTTNFNGSFTGSFITGNNYYFSASKDSYDTLLLGVSVIRGSTTTQDFHLVNGTCHADCTNSYGRCNALCDGMNFTDGKCSFYNTGDNAVKNACNNRLAGTEVYLSQQNDTYAWFVQCCGSGGEQPYLKYYATAQTDAGNAKNLIKVEKIAKYNDVPVRLVVAYWQ